MPPVLQGDHAFEAKDSPTATHFAPKIIRDKADFNPEKQISQRRERNSKLSEVIDKVS